MQKCPRGKIVNPATGRCVNAYGKIGLAIAQQESIAEAIAGKTPTEKKSTVVSGLQKLLAKCIKNKDEIKINGIVPFEYIAKFQALDKYKQMKMKMKIETNKIDHSQTKYEFGFHLWKLDNKWCLNATEIHHSSSGRGASNLLRIDDVIDSQILVNPKLNDKQFSKLELLYETLHNATILNTSVAPLYFYKAIKQSVPKPTVYNGLESAGFKPQGTNANTTTTQGRKAITRVVDGVLADLIDKNKYTSELLVKEAKRAKWNEGDVIGIKKQLGYRNNGKVFWNGKRCINMNTDIDDYGSVPDAFPITGKPDGFDGYTWIDEVDHNSLVPVNFGAKIGREINAYLKQKEYDYFVFTVHGVNWAVCGHGTELVGGKGYLSATPETKLVASVVAKYGIPLRQVLMFNFGM